ncbi:uncharacterized protein LOC141611337 [Silene latifolia]|uniref:uncharacterized protein LOC141611337 n=1 Tax=Silene latifolia TaxID=37657 RepID=UPI003D77B7B8
MSSNDEGPRPVTRRIYPTESSWCRAVPGGTGVTTLSLLIKNNTPHLHIQSALRRLQTNHPILRATLNPTTSTFIIPPLSSLTLHSSSSESPFHSLVEQELNLNPWNSNAAVGVGVGVDVMHATIYDHGNGSSTLVIKLHTAACDRTAAVQLVKELMHIVVTNNNSHDADVDVDVDVDGDVGLGIEEYVPDISKPFWARGIDMLGYSLNSFRLSNFNFLDPVSHPSSRLVRLMLDAPHTSMLLQGCKRRGIKLCGALSAAGLIAARLAKGLSDGDWEKYAVVTLIDCRKLLEPPLSNHHIGFYHSAILNTHDMCGGEELWGLATRTYKSFENAKKSNKHFSDMADLNFLMCKAIENPGLTPSSSMRTSFISVFEDPVVDETNEKYEQLGVEDYMGCASVHGVGPSVAVFDTIRDGKLDCACVYPFPLHSREQMQELIDKMKNILIHCLSSENEC